MVQAVARTALVLGSKYFHNPRTRLLGRCFSSRTSSFFSYTSGRARRKRHRRALKRERLKAKESWSRESLDDGDYLDKRTVRDILFPNPFKGPEIRNENAFQWPTSFAMWKQALSMAWKEYRSTWDGFFTSRGFLVQDKSEVEKKESDEQNLGDELAKKKDDVVQNVKRNVEFMGDEFEKVQKEVREKTGIHSTEDLKRLVGEWMRLAADCVKEFMAGYRKGRDDEVEKMLTQYFKDLEEEANKPKEKRRRPKRRVLSR